MGNISGKPPRPAAPPNPWKLSHSECRVLELLTKDLTQVQVARLMFRSNKTVSTHLDRIKNKLNVRTPGMAAIMWDRFARPNFGGPERMTITLEVWPRALHVVAIATEETPA